MPRIKSAHNKTAATILQTAGELFIQKGFSGTSINDIASLAQVNKSLIYHHFTNKEGLWKAVKEDILKSYTSKQNTEIYKLTNLNLKEFLNEVVRFRFHLYADNPNLIRLMLWQRLENNEATLSLFNDSPYWNYINAQILVLQERGEVRQDIQAETLSYFIVSNGSNLFFDQMHILKYKNQEDLEQYLDATIALLYSALKNNAK
jgi:AcrR family transcriptional regulator